MSCNIRMLALGYRTIAFYVRLLERGGGGGLKLHNLSRRPSFRGIVRISAAALLAKTKRRRQVVLPTPFSLTSRLRAPVNGSPATSCELCSTFELINLGLDVKVVHFRCDRF